MKALHHIIVSSAECTGDFNAGFDTGNLHHPTSGALPAVKRALEPAQRRRKRLVVAAQVECESKT